MVRALFIPIALAALWKIASAEIVYLANCDQAFLSGSEVWWTTGTGPVSKTGWLKGDPRDTNVDDRVKWEGKTTCGNFPDTQLCAFIESNAASQSYQTYVGHATNGYGTTFDCYKGNGRILYNPNPGAEEASCESVYYCSN
ncbi:hypothetical protein GQ53DRAFT_760518 [Thozetella sp. PMI_491]|nr:hypothetical protein GQ53DRAFT_760518 [Thozetella sp. PMI_491]